MFDGRHAGAVFLQHGRKAGVADGAGGSGNLDGRIEVNAREDDAGACGCRAQRQRHLTARVQPDADGLDEGLDGALFQHGRPQLTKFLRLFLSMRSA